jgi:hypothetical protein
MKSHKNPKDARAEKAAVELIRAVWAIVKDAEVVSPDGKVLSDAGEEALIFSRGTAMFAEAITLLVLKAEDLSLPDGICTEQTFAQAISQVIESWAHGMVSTAQHGIMPVEDFNPIMRSAIQRWSDSLVRISIMADQDIELITKQ